MVTVVRHPCCSTAPAIGRLKAHGGSCRGPLQGLQVLLHILLVDAASTPWRPKQGRSGAWLAEHPLWYGTCPQSALSSVLCSLFATPRPPFACQHTLSQQGLYSATFNLPLLLTYVLLLLLLLLSLLLPPASVSNPSSSSSAHHPQSDVHTQLSHQSNNPPMSEVRAREIIHTDF